MADGDPPAPRPFSARPQAKFSTTSDFHLWTQRFELYILEAGLPAEKKSSELLSLLEDEPFRVVSQLGLVSAATAYEDIKKALQQQFSPTGTETEWQFKLQSRRQKPEESLAEFAGQLRMLVDRAYPDWEPKQRLELARNQFIQGIHSSTTQLVLMKDKPKDFAGALELAQATEAVQTAQKRTCMRTATVKENEVNVLTPPTGQFQELSHQVKQLTEAVARLQATPTRGRRPQYQGRYRGQFQQGQQGPVCWSCHQRGHVRRNCPQQQQIQPPTRQPKHRGLGNSAVESTLAVEGLVGSRVTRMLVDTGSAVTILREEVWKGAGSPPIEALHRPVVAANGEELRLLGQTRVTITLGEFKIDHQVLVARELTQGCLLGADFLTEHGCVVNLQTMCLSTGQQTVPLLQQTESSCNCCVFVAEPTQVPAQHQQQVRVCLSSGDGPVTSEQIGVLIPEPKFLENHGVLAAHSLSTIDRSMKSVVCILNPNPSQATFHKGEKLGNLQVLQSTEVLALSPQKSTETIHLPSMEKEAALQQMEADVDGLSTSQRFQLHKLLSDHIDVISTGPGDLGRTKLLKHKVNTGNSAPVRQPLRRLPYHKREEVDKMLDDMLSQGVIEPACGPWSSPIVLITKKDGSSRSVSISGKSTISPSKMLIQFQELTILSTLYLVLVGFLHLI